MSEYTTTRSDGCVASGTMVDGKVHGTVTVTYPNGQTKSLTHFDMNKPTGLHEYWNDDGSVESTILYDENGQVSEIDGQPVPSGEGEE